MSLTIDAAAAYRPSKVSDARVVIDQGRFVAIGSRRDTEARGDTLDAGDAIVVPGFVDTHVHGAGGADVMLATPEAIAQVSLVLASRGTTRFLPTTVSAAPDVLDDVLRRLGDICTGSFAGAQPAGIHMEGPFIARTRRGTHPEPWIQSPAPELFRRWNTASRSRVRLVTMAPEIQGADELLGVLEKAGAAVAMGHSDATAEEALRAVDRGVRYAVHTFNAMRGIHHREPGIAGLVLSDDRVWAEIIADGVHVAPGMVKVFARAKGRERVLLVSDATSAAGMPDGSYPLGGNAIVVEHGVARDHDGRLAGSTLTQDQAMRNFMEWTGWTLEDVLPALTVNPARAAGLDAGAGVLEVGGPADLVVLDPELRVVRTYVGGRLVYDAVIGERRPGA